MRPQWVFLAELAVVVLESGAFLIIGYVLCLRHQWARPLAIAVGTLCIGYRILTSTFPDRFYIESPHLILTGLLTPAGFLLLAAALSVRRRRSSERVLIGVFSVVLTYYVFCDAAYLVVKGPEIAQLTGSWQGNVMLQSKPFTCGPAAAASLLQAWGIFVNEGDLAFGARTSFRGTELPKLADAIRFFGRYKPLKVEVMSTTLDELRTRNKPAILLVARGRRRHVVTLLGLEGRKMFVADPSNGGLELGLDEFRSMYEWRGRAIVAWRDPASEKPLDGPPAPRLHQ